MHSWFIARAPPIANSHFVHFSSSVQPGRHLRKSRRASIVGAVVCAIAIAQPAASRAQTPTVAFGGYRLDTWQTGSTTSSLPANNVNFLAQSSDGYLWLATSAGMARFDGLRFDLITPASSPAFTGRLAYLVWPMQIAGRDTLWIATDRGMVPYANGTFSQSAPDTTFEGEAVQQLATDASGLTYGVTVRGSAFKIVAGRYVRIPLSGVPVSDGYGIVADSDGTLWIAHDRAGLVRLQRGVITRFGIRDGLGDDHATCVFRSKDGALWVGTRTGVARYVNGAFTTTIKFWEGLPTHPVFSAAETGDGAIWFATDGGGVVRVTKQTGGEYTATKFTQRDGLTDDRAIALLADRDGNVWVGTRLGLNRFHPVPFQAITMRDGLPASAMGAILLDASGQLWVAPVAGGLYRGRVVAGRAQMTMVAPPDRGRVTTLAKGRKGSVWAGWDRGGVTNFPTSGAQRYLGVQDGVAPGTVFAIVDAPGGDLWIGTRGGLTRLSGVDRGPLGVRNFTTRDGLQEDVAMRLWTHYPTDMWVGNAALSHIVGDSVRTFRVVDGLAAPLITAIHTDTSGSIWVGTHGGLSRLLHRKMVALRSAQGFTDEYVDAIEGDDSGHLWIAGARGLTRFSLADLDSTSDALLAGRKAQLTSALTFGAADGLPGQDFVLDASPGSFHAPDGTLWFSMAWGIAVVDPSRVPRDTLRPYVHIEGLTADGQPQNVHEAVELPAETRRVEIRYTGVSLSDGAGVRLRYRLDGLDTSWVESDAQRLAAFTRLPPGTYNLRVAARSERGSWGDSEARLRFRVLPAFYQRWWFIALALALAGVAGWLIARYRRKQLEARLQAVVEERTRMARELHDTLLQGFTGIALQLRAIGARRQHALNAGASVEEKSDRDADSSRALDALVAVAESTLSEARHAVWDMRAPIHIPAAPGGSAFVDRLERSAREVIGTERIALDFAVAGDRRPLDPTVEEELGRIAREAIANAVRHGAPRRIVVSLVYEPAALRLTVRDDGRGFDASAPPNARIAADGRGHFGLVGMRERAARIGARLAVTSEISRGTTVLVVLPRA
jgi:signal transduction histidine kinase/ligand-binding sensor domain-containing protein